MPPVPDTSDRVPWPAASIGAAGRRAQGWGVTVRIAVLVGAAYMVVGLIGMSLAVPPSNATLIFPAAGLAVAAALRFGSPAVWGTGLGQFFMHVVRHGSDGIPSPLSIGCWAMIAAGAAMQAAVAVMLVRLWKGRRWREAIDERRTFGFLFFCGAAACVVSASVGVGTLAAAGFVEQGEFTRVWLNWYTGDTLGVFIFAPLTLLLLHRDAGRTTAGDWQVVWRMVAILAIIMIGFFAVRRWEAWAREATLRTDALAIANRIAIDGIEPALHRDPLPRGLRITLRTRTDGEHSETIFESSPAPTPAAGGLRHSVPVPAFPTPTTLDAVADDTYLRHRFDVSWLVAILSLVVAGILADRDFVVLSAVNREAATRIEKERIQRDLAIAREIQQGLLPTVPPSMPGFDIAGWSEPADETGGDYFDFMPLDGGELAVAIADVTGHGIGAALVVAEVRALFRAEILRSPDLLTAVTSVHALIGRDLSSDRFVTACFAVVSSPRSTVRYVSAGHGPILTYSLASDSVSEHPPHGLPLGFLPTATYAVPTEIALAPGDVFMVLTDGFFEWTDRHGKPFGVDRIREFLRAHHDLPARELIERLRGDVVEFSGGTRQADDLTSIVVKRLA
ncbi:MAG: SpoIIE family protein phosphatase [Planctomycetia bacterium]